MAVTPTNLPTNIESSYPKRGPGDVAHQSHADIIHNAVNEMTNQWSDVAIQTSMIVQDDGGGLFNLDVGPLFGLGGRVILLSPPNPPELWGWQPNTPILPGTWIEVGETIYVARPWGFTLGTIEPDWAATDQFGNLTIEGVSWRPADFDDNENVQTTLDWQPETFMPRGWYWHLGYLWYRDAYEDDQLTGEVEPDWQWYIDEGWNWFADGDADWYRDETQAVLWSPGTQVIGHAIIVGGGRAWQTIAGGYAPLVTGSVFPDEPNYGSDYIDGNVRWDDGEGWRFEDAHEEGFGIARVRLAFPSEYKEIYIDFGGHAMFFGLNDAGLSFGSSSDSDWWFQWNPVEPYWYDD